MGLIIGRIEIPAGAVIYTDPKTGVTYVQMDVEEGEDLRITMKLFSSESSSVDDGTGCHNSASILVKNETYAGEEEVSTMISVGDPRGCFTMESRANETGHYLSVPHHEDSGPHVEMEHKSRGFYQLKYLKREPTEEEEHHG